MEIEPVSEICFLDYRKTDKAQINGDSDEYY
jgi:hypothetical protein